MSSHGTDISSDWDDGSSPVWFLNPRVFPGESIAELHQLHVFVDYYENVNDARIDLTQPPNPAARQWAMEDIGRVITIAKIQFGINAAETNNFKIAVRALAHGTGAYNEPPFGEIGARWFSAGCQLAVIRLRIIGMHNDSGTLLPILVNDDFNLVKGWYGY